MVEPESDEMKTKVLMCIGRARIACAVMRGPMVLVCRRWANAENDLLKH